MPSTDPNDYMSEMAKVDSQLDMRALLCDILNAFGGRHVFANEVVENLRASELGSTGRTQGNNNILVALQKFGHVEGEGGDEDIPSVEAELRQALSKTSTPDEE